MIRQERPYQTEDPDSDRWVRSIHAYLGKRSHVEILSKETDNHPLRADAERTMQSLHRRETTKAAELLLTGIGKSQDNQQIKAAQFLFAHLNLMKIEPNALRDAFSSAVTEQTPVKNIRAVVQTAGIVAPDLNDNNSRLALHQGLNSIKNKLRKEKIMADIKHEIMEVKSQISNSKSNSTSNWS